MRKKLVGDLDRVKQPSAVLGTRSGRADDRLREWGLGQVGEDVADAEGLQDAATRAESLTADLMAFGRDAEDAPVPVDLALRVRLLHPLLRATLPAS